ncbi:MAG: 50S ribosomal protein L27 [candidate division WWE3 bacterium GW2011_GWA1_46_21]|uniref:Large ribosomal subunit protein bL27 n=4 Tax=Katanobacteria TaxID=422282 RepID=A0A0G1SBG4_UNCKA|nr:MAG: 50S ribosomal protein L27 [candidate division WWE3 bacterium GW2011_GWA1_46_21]KKU49246.1 MAG: 50S ribosomal protein L27 [candidate division WWE3 bacterium GW2011_GWA2_46_9]KKU50613.1 MAG: 50S ribosomal protein L27, large subunit ribosomal protein L27 [candidate division WWE3 bacterium GW2011_GWC1_47_10]KKU57334.1 MAG: 50S ribosomal protein L27 [candidate division WWE3 bacterium GW2011_GWB1_47_11]
MAHKKAGGASAQQKGNVAGKRLGIKVSGGSVVKPGQIIARQRGKTFLPGNNVGMGKDFTIYSLVNGIVAFVYATRRKKKINVVLSKQSQAA